MIVRETNSHLSIENKSLIYKSVIKLILIFGIEIWGCVSKSKILIMLSAKTKFLCTITNAPRYVTYHILNTKVNIL